MDALFGELLPVLDLKAAFKLLDRIVPKSPSLPVLKYIKIEGDGDTAILTATDLSSFAEIRVQNPRPFHGVEIVEYSKFKQSHGLRAWNGFPCDILPEDYPAITLPENQEAFQATWVQDALPCAPFASTDMTRLALNGVCLDHEYAVATDGHRMNAVKVSGYEGSTILPTSGIKAAGAIKEAPEKVVKCVGAVSEHLVSYWPWGCYGFQLVEGPYPDFRQVFVKHVAWTFTVDQKAIKVLPVAKNDQIHWKNGELFISRAGSGILDSTGIICQLDTMGELPTSNATSQLVRNTIAWNALYFVEMVSVCKGPKVKVSGNTAIQATAFDWESEGQRIVMPVRVTG